MIRKLLATTALAGLMAFSAQGAEAALLSVSGGTPYVTPSNNNWAVGLPGVVNFVGFPLTIATTADNVELVYEYVFKEATRINELRADGSSISAAGDSITVNQALAGALDFEFFTPVPLSGITVANGNDATQIAGGAVSISFFVTNIDPDTGLAAEDTLWLAFDDGGGLLDGVPDDDNHDDLIIKLTAHAVDIPEPATLGLLGAGLAGLGFAARRRRTA